MAPADLTVNRFNLLYLVVVVVRIAAAHVIGIFSLLCLNKDVPYKHPAWHTDTKTYITQVHDVVPPSPHDLSPEGTPSGLFTHVDMHAHTCSGQQFMQRLITGQSPLDK